MIIRKCKVPLGIKLTLYLKEEIWEEKIRIDFKASNLVFGRKGILRRKEFQKIYWNNV